MNKELSQRQRYILKLLEEKNYCTIEELAIYFTITTQTVRRDINALCDLGLARRHHGGVGLPTAFENSSFTSRKVSHTETKHEMASHVVAAIPNGSTVFLGIGSTMSAIAEQLSEHKELRVITNNFEAAAILIQFDHVETWVSGGRLRTNDRDILGVSSNEFFDQFSADIGIISCAAVNELKAPKTALEHTINKEMQECVDHQKQEWCLEHEPQEAQASQAILNNSKETWLVAHEQKWHISANTKVALVDSFDRVFKA